MQLEETTAIVYAGGEYTTYEVVQRYDGKDLPQMVKSLALARQEAQDAKSEMDQVLARLMASPEYLEAKARNDAAIAALTACDQQARQEALAIYNADTSRTRPHPTIQIRMVRNVQPGEPDKVLSFCKTYLPAALKIDMELFKTHVRAVQATQPVPAVVAQVAEVATVYIAKDLTAYTIP